jgi:hypothetical protein
MTYRPVSVFLAVMFAWLLCCTVPGCGRDETGTALENYKKLQEGMTLEEVEAILGPGGEETDDPRLLSAQREVKKLPASAKWRKWKLPGNDEEVYIAVAFDGGKVVSKAKVGFR